MRGNASHARNYFGHFMPWARDLDGVQGWEWFDGDVEGQIIDLACAGGLGVDGDHLESGSPMDPSFWPIHPTMERLWLFKKLAGGFTDEAWPSVDYATVDGCHGHKAGDVIPFRFSLKTQSSLSDGSTAS